MMLGMIFFALLVSQGLANLEVMRVIAESQKRLSERGFFRKVIERDSIFGQPQECIDGKVTLGEEDFACNNIDFLSFLSMKELEILDVPHDPPTGIRASDIWGIRLPTTSGDFKELTLLALDNGAAVIDSTDPINPCIIAKLPSGRIPARWGDIKVYESTMYHVKDTSTRDNSPNAPEGNAEYGIEVYELKDLVNIDCNVEDYVPMNLFPIFVFEGHGRSHNLEINTATGHLYSVGSEKCGGGLVILDLKPDRNAPVQVGCVDQDGYTHDVQCIVYDGPDTRFTDKEICFAFNEDTLTIWDVTDPANPIEVSRTPYPNQVYSHQGWVNNDLTLILLDDELDEVCNNNLTQSRRCIEANELSGELRTSTNVFDIRDLTAPVFQGAYKHPEQSIDHNLYVWGRVHRTGQGGNPPMEFHPDPNFAYMNNYLAGLKVVDISSDDFTQWTEAGTFDIAPEITEIEFGGAWSGYMHPSGVYAISSIERGLFLLQPRMAFTEDFPQGVSPSSAPTDFTSDPPAADPTSAPIDFTDPPAADPTSAPIEFTDPPAADPTSAPIEFTDPPAADPTSAPIEFTDPPAADPTSAPIDFTDPPAADPTSAPVDGAGASGDDDDTGAEIALVIVAIIFFGIVAFLTYYTGKKGKAKYEQAQQKEPTLADGKAPPSGVVAVQNPMHVAEEEEAPEV